MSRIIKKKKSNRFGQLHIPYIPFSKVIFTIEWMDKYISICGEATHDNFLYLLEEYIYMEGQQPSLNFFTSDYKIKKTQFCHTCEKFFTKGNPSHDEHLSHNYTDYIANLANSYY